MAGDDHGLRARVVRFVRWKVRRHGAHPIDSHEMDDIVQETLCRALDARRRRAFDVSRDFVRYVMGIAAKVLSDCLRLRVRVTHAHPDWIDMDMLASSVPANDDEEVDEHLLCAVKAWKAEQSAEIVDFVLHRYERGLSQRKVAAALGITHRRVRTLEGAVAAALAKLVRRRARCVPVRERDHHRTSGKISPGNKLRDTNTG
jgi:RNA polymerase sigma factor (sigma-70 family)